MYPDNNWYGHRYILNKYCNCLDKPIFATLQHGWISDEEAKELISSAKEQAIKTEEGSELILVKAPPNAVALDPIGMPIKFAALVPILS